MLCRVVVRCACGSIRGEIHARPTRGRARRRSNHGACRRVLVHVGNSSAHLQEVPMRWSKPTVAVAVIVGVAFGAGPAAGATTPAQPYVTLPSVLVTNVGQHPQLVGQYGNRGGTTLNNVSFSCRVVRSDGSVAPLQRLVSSPFTAPFIPGQNANFQFEGTAFRVGSGTQVQCSVTGVEAGTGIRRTALSNITTYQVHP